MTDEYAGKFETGVTAPAVPHLKFLDGMRGVAALYVVIHHSAQDSYWHILSPKWLFFLRWGRAAVTVFIAISGYCLGLPVVRAGLSLKGGALRFYGKRARRILAPYYAALALGIAVAIFLLTPAGARVSWLTEPTIERGIWAHIFMVHNWFPSLEFLFNGPLWSVATEMQIYLLFPLMVLIWRRFGVGWMLGFSGVVAYGMLLATGHRGSIDYIFIFALGVWASEFRLNRRNRLAVQVAFYASVAVFLALPDVKDMYGDLFVGVGASCLMVLCAQSNFWVRPVLSLRVLTWLGGFSYSIYLVHNVIQTIYVDTAIGPFPRFAEGGTRFLFMCFGLIPIIVVVSYVFHVAIERPFMTVHRPRMVGKTAQAAVPAHTR